MIVIVLVLIFLLLVGNELWSRRRQPHTELSRKFIHVTVGSLVAFWPFWFSWQQIEILSALFLVVLVISKLLGVFQAIHSVQRPTWGEFFFAISVGGVPLLTHNRWIYVAALLQMALADGLAAIVGVTYGNGQAYTVFRHKKTLLGTATFFLVSLTILIVSCHLGHVSLSVPQLLGVSALVTVLENLGIAGLDNLFVPVAVTLLLKHLV